MSKDHRKSTGIEELPREVEELTPQEADEAKGGLGMVPRLLSPNPPPIMPQAQPDGPPI